MRAIDHLTRPAGVSPEDFVWFCHELDRVLAQLRRTRNTHSGHPCQPLRRPKARRHTRR